MRDKTKITLRLQPKDEAPRTYELSEGKTFQIGRDSENDIVIIDRLVSRAHASISFSGRRCIVSDLFSRNGTFLNGRQITGECEVNDGDTIDVGSAKILVQFQRVKSTAKEIESSDSSTVVLTTGMIPIAFCWSNQAAEPKYSLESFKADLQSYGIAIAESNVDWLVAFWSDGIIPSSPQSVLAEIESFLEKHQAVSAAMRIVLAMTPILADDQSTDKQIDFLGDLSKPAAEIRKMLEPFNVPVIYDDSFASALNAPEQFEQVASFKPKGEGNARVFHQRVASINPAG